MDSRRTETGLAYDVNPGIASLAVALSYVKECRHAKMRPACSRAVWDYCKKTAVKVVKISTLYVQVAFLQEQKRKFSESRAEVAEELQGEWIFVWILSVDDMKASDLNLIVGDVQHACEECGLAISSTVVEVLLLARNLVD